MPQISFAQLNASSVLVGPKRDKLLGAAETFWSLEMDGDLGGVIRGVQGDSMHYSTVNNVFTLTFSALPTASSIGVVMRLARTRNMFDISIEMNDFSFNGYATLINPGAWTAGSTPSPRDMTMGLTYVSGNIWTGLGEVVEAGG